jgi:N-acetylglucosamine-6-phosphate deacetylase
MNMLAVTSLITADTLAFAPAVLAGVSAAETAAPLAPGTTKQAAVVNAVLQGIQVGSGELETSANPTVAGVATLVNLFVSIFNALKVFKHATPGTPPA